MVTENVDGGEGRGVGGEHERFLGGNGCWWGRGRLSGSKDRGVGGEYAAFLGGCICRCWG